MGDWTSSSRPIFFLCVQIRKNPNVLLFNKDQSVVSLWLGRLFSTKEIHFDHILSNLTICRLSECVIFSIRNMSSIVSIHSLTVGGSGCSQCLVIFFLATVTMIIKRYLLVFPVIKSDLPKIKVSNWLGIFIWNISSIVLWTSDQKFCNPGHFQNICQWFASRPPHPLQHMGSFPV